MDRKVLNFFTTDFSKITNNFNVGYRLESNGSRTIMYTSPNSFIETTMNLNDIEFYTHPSSFSLPTSDINQYENIAKDVLDYKNFMDSFETIDYESAIKRTIVGGY